MGQRKTIQIDVPLETWRRLSKNYSDSLSEQEKRQIKSKSYGSNDLVAEMLFREAVLPYLGEELEGNSNVVANSDGTIEVQQERSDDGTFQ